MGAERRFVLLFACAIFVVVAIGVSGYRADRHDAPLAVTLVERQAPPPTTTAAQAPAVTEALQPLWTTELALRFPHTFASVRRPRPVLDGRQIISYYGNPHTPDMGILGAADPETIISRLQRHAELYDELNGELGTIAAIHLVYAVAQYHPTDNGLYLQHLDDATLRRYVELTEERGMLLFVDLQIGRSSVAAEIERVLPSLAHPHVHLALDPEFAVTSGQVPGTDLGSLSADDIDRAQRMLQRLVEERDLPPKLLIVHQFADSMLRDGEEIERYPAIDLVLDMDGFGPAEIKRVKYEDLARRSYASRAGIKLFFEHDPDLMSEQDVLRLQPTPSVVIYQ
jgi:hypothetical protein